MNENNETTRLDPGSLLYDFAARAMQIYSVAELFAQHHDASDEPGPAFSLIADEALKLNGEMFELAGKIKGNLLDRLGVVREPAEPEASGNGHKHVGDREPGLYDENNRALINRSIERLQFVSQGMRDMQGADDTKRRELAVWNMEAIEGARERLAVLHNEMDCIRESGHGSPGAETGEAGTRTASEPTFDDEHYLLLRGIVRAGNDVFREINQPEEGGINRPAVEASCVLQSLVDQLERALSPEAAA